MLEALRVQHGDGGSRLPYDSYEVLLLLNNCTDSSPELALAFQRTHPEMRLHVVHHVYPDHGAHVGRVRRILMESACLRFADRGSGTRAILSTDADTIVAADWIGRNVDLLEGGADLVGGAIEIDSADLQTLAKDHPDTYRAYLSDRAYRQKVALLESLLDPDVHDPWPRHLDHFGASLACTQEIYERAGGLPVVTHLEDVAFIDAVRRVDGRIRHALDVRVRTSGRLQGRVQVGLSGQLRHWRDDREGGRSHLVPNTAWLKHRFTTLALLRSLHGVPGSHAEALAGVSERWRRRILSAATSDLTQGMFLAEIDCDRLIAETFPGTFPRSAPPARFGHIDRVIESLDLELSRFAPVHPTGTALPDDDAGDGSRLVPARRHAPDRRSTGNRAPLVSSEQE